MNNESNIVEQLAILICVPKTDQKYAQQVLLKGTPINKVILKYGRPYITRKMLDLEGQRLYEEYLKRNKTMKNSILLIASMCLASPVLAEINMLPIDQVCFAPCDPIEFAQFLKLYERCWQIAQQTPNKEEQERKITEFLKKVGSPIASLILWGIQVKNNEVDNDYCNNSCTK